MTKLYAAKQLIHLPHSWYTAIGGTHHAAQGNLVVAAHVKADVPDMLTDRSLNQHTADRLAKVAVSRPLSSLPTDLDALVTSGAMTMAVPGVYVYLRSYAGNAVFRVDPPARLDGDPTFVEIARFAQRPGAAAGVVGVEDLPL